MIINVIRKVNKVWNQLIKSKGSVHYDSSPPLQTKKTENNYVRELARRYGGKLLLQSEIAIPEVIFHKLLSYSYFTPLSSIEKNIHKTSCRRCTNEKPSLLRNMICAKCSKTHLYCRKCINMGRVLACEKLYYWSGINYTWEKHINPCTWTGKLTTAQQRAAEEIIETITDSGKLLIWAVTGSGKTEMLFPGIATALKNGKRVCIATPRADVVRELLPRLQDAFQQIHIQALYSGSRDNDGTAQLIIATTHQLLRYRHAFDVLIIDEIDAFPYHHDESLQFAATRAVKKVASLIYLTATPRKELRKQVLAKKINYVFVPIRFHGHPLPIPKLTYCPSMKRQLDVGTIPVNFHRWIEQREKRTRQLLIFVPTISLANKLVERITELFISEKLIETNREVVNVHAEDKKREEKIHLFRNQKIIVLITTTILERGVTFPSIDVAVLDAGHDVFDDASLVQIAGRAGRSPADPTGEVVFFHDGKTDAIVRSREEIVKMNKRSRKLRTRSE